MVIVKGLIPMKRIESKNNPRVKKWKKLHTKKGRDRHGQFCLEGVHLVEEALSNNVEISELIVADGFRMPNEWDVGGLPVYQITETLFRDISQTEHPQGVAAVCRKRNASVPETLRGRFLLIDAVQDPGNIGTMIRTADAAGLAAVILGKGCADSYNDKVVRATQGSLFHLPVIQGDLHEWVDKFQRKGVTVFGTDLEEATPYTDISPPENYALIVGNEGSGIAPALLEQTDERLAIPVYGRAESLNVAVAAGILLYGLQK